MRLRNLSLPTKIVIGLVAGAITGVIFKDAAVHLEPIGTIFFRLIALIVVPLVFVSLLIGTASVGDIRKMGRIGGKTFVYFIGTTVVAATLGLLLVNILQPGTGVEFQEVAQEQLNLQGAKSRIEFVVDLVPANPFKAFIETNMLQIIILALLFGAAITAIPEEKRTVLMNLLDSLNKTFIQVVHIVLKVAPYGVFALIASTVGKFGLDLMVSLL